MRTGVKVILAAMSVAVLVSPVMAQNWQYPTAPVRPDVSTDNVFWGQVYDPAFAYGAAASAQGSYGSAAGAYGSAAGAPVGRGAPGLSVDGNPRIIDCVHVTFPQCSSGGN
jgi:hypothetical protein